MPTVQEVAYSSGGGTPLTVIGGTAATNVTTTGAWYAWVNAGTGTMTSTSATTLVWDHWITPSASTIAPVGPPRVLTEEEIAAQRAEQERLAAEASARATALLEESLDPAQKAEFARERAFTVISADGQRTYRIRKGWSANVDLLRDGKVVRRYCAHPKENVPDEDNMLAQKLFLEADEPAFLRVANAS